jgi:hypothetical protein
MKKVRGDTSGSLIGMCVLIRMQLPSLQNATQRDYAVNRQTETKLALLIPISKTHCKQ